MRLTYWSNHGPADAKAFAEFSVPGNLCGGGETMTRFARWVTVVVSLCASAMAGITPGSISGYVRSSAGAVQMGATVEVLGTGAVQHEIVYTDAKGYFTLSGLLPGNYDVRVSAPAFLPTLREDVVIAAGASKVLNITLNTLFEAVKMMPTRKRANQEDDSWKWTLRSTASRPILRFDGDNAVMVESDQNDRKLQGTLAFMAGGSNEGYGSSADMGTAFKVEQSIFTNGTIALDGNFGYATGTPDGVVRASYKHVKGDGSSPEIAFTARRFSCPDMFIRHELQALAVSFSDGFSLGDTVEFQYGGEAQTIQFLGRANAFRPYGAVDLHLGDDTILEYRYTTNEPNSRNDKGFDSAPADFSESGPRMTLVNNAPLLENAHHQEVSLSQRIATDRLGDNKVQIAFFNDRIKDPALLGVGTIGVDSGDMLPDVYSGTFSYNGGELAAQGVRALIQHKFSDSLTGTLDYAYGGVLGLDQSYLDWADVRAGLHHEWRHTAALKLNGTFGHTKAHWIASYRWTSGDALTAVDLFNATAGQADPGFSFFFRQPFPHLRFMPGRMEALVDLRNLLAQGYVPVYGPDGKTVYLVQSARSVRGGLAFTF